MSSKGMSQDVLVLRVTLMDYDGRVRGMPYRHIAIPAGLSLEMLAYEILESFDFDSDHPFGFYDNLRNWTRASERYEIFADMGESEPGVRGVNRTKTGSVFHSVGRKMLFLFDYGDEWKFAVRLEKVVPQEEGVGYPVVLKSRGEAPPQYEV